MDYRTVYPVTVLQGFSENSMFVLMLYDPIGIKKVPIMIGEHEAEMIILEQAPHQQARRPMTYQLIVEMMEAFSLSLEKVRIDRFEEGIFYATLVVSDGFNERELDARASDAVVLALNQSVDIVMAQSVIDEVGFTPQDNDMDLGETLSESDTIESLEEELRLCEEREEYERAEEIMQKIKRLKELHP